MDVADAPAIEPLPDFALVAHGVFVGKDELSDRAEAEQDGFTAFHGNVSRFGGKGDSPIFAKTKIGTVPFMHSPYGGRGATRTR